MDTGTTTALERPARDPVSPLPDTVRIDRHTTSIDLVEMAMWADVASGRTPHTRTRHLDQPIAPCDLLGPSARITRSATTDGVAAALAEDGICLILIRTAPDGCTIRVAAATAEEATRRANALCSSVVAPPECDSHPIRIWHRSGPLGATAKERTIDAPAWDDIARNYPPQTRQRLTWLHALGAAPPIGRLILWHGEPGTGKTTAARSLIRTWQPWCSTEYIADPEQLLGDPAYLNDVLTRPNTPTGRPTLSDVTAGPSRWRLIVAEDIDRVAGIGGRHGGGPDLGRLLDLTDGIAGQGTRTLVLLTANTPAGDLDPALLRPGRAAAVIGFERFDLASAQHWLGRPPPAADLTLAELYQLDSDPAPGLATPSGRHFPTGQYV